MLLENRDQAQVNELNVQLGLVKTGLAGVPSSAMSQLEEMRAAMNLPKGEGAKRAAPARPKAGDFVPLDVTASKMPTSSDMATETSEVQAMLARFRKPAPPPGD